VGTPDMWSMPFLLRATPRQGLAEWSVRSEANLTAAGHSGDTPGQTPNATDHRNALSNILHQGIMRSDGPPEEGSPTRGTRGPVRRLKVNFVAVYPDGSCVR
jgi:hypothetical protein